jgi:histidinol-phosphate aminotransferase
MNSLEFVRDEILAIRGYVSGEQPPVGKFIKLNTNENPFPPSNSVITAIQQAATQGLNVYPDALANSFRICAAQMLGLEKDWILCGNGSDDLLTMLTRTFVSSGSTIRIPYPSYVLYRTLGQIQGARTEEIHFEKDWRLPSSFYENSSSVSLVFLPNPNSPSGTVLSPEQVLQIADQLDCPLVVDEAYADFSDTNCIGLVREAENVIVTRTLSKSYGLAGLRFGYAVARPEIIQQLQKVKDSYNCDALAIAGATAAINDQSWLTENRSTIGNLRQQMASDLKRRGFEVTPSQANFVWCHHPKISSNDLYQQLKSNQILVRYMDYPDWGSGIRISVGTSSQITALMAILDTIVAENNL